MRGTVAALGVVALGGVFAWGVVRLFDRQFASGEAYPEFSSLRTDRRGTRLLHDSLSALPGITVERNFRPFEFLPRDGAALLLLGMGPAEVNRDPALLRSVEAVASRGNRVVVAMHVAPDNVALTQRALDRIEVGKGKTSDPPLKTHWGVTLLLDSDVEAEHRLMFAQTGGWRTIEAANKGALAIEREFGKGSVLLMTESADFVNSVVVDVDRLPSVTRAVGGFRRVIFDEQHLGIAESGTVVGMARQFRLMGLAFGLALCAALFIWRNASPFPPAPAHGVRDGFSGRTSHSGLLTLLRRHIPAAEVAGVCWREWLTTNGAAATAETRSKAESVLARDGTRPMEATREIQDVVQRKGRP